MHIPLSRAAKFLVGDPVIARYAFSNHSIYAQDSTDLIIQSITIYTSWFMGIITTRIKRLNIINFHVRPRDGRWISIIVACLHLTDNRENISIIDSECQFMGDIHSSYFNISQVINSIALIIQSAVHHG